MTKYLLQHWKTIGKSKVEEIFHSMFCRCKANIDKGITNANSISQILSCKGDSNRNK